MPKFHASQPLLHQTELFGGRLRVAVPAELEVEPVDEDPEPIDYTLKMTLDVVDGRLHCVELCVRQRPGGAPVTTEGIRRIPVGSYVQRAALHLGVVQEVRPIAGSPGELEVSGWIPPAADFAAGGMTDDTLKEAARVYMWAMATGDRPYGVLERDFSIPRAKASRWIATARRRGFLGQGA